MFNLDQVPACLRPRRLLRLLTCLVLLAAAGLTVASSPASASWTLYCTGYSGCAKAGYGNGGYSAVSQTMFWRMYGGHNCTNYVAYRMVHAGMPNVRPWSGDGNATNWGVARADLTNGTPSVGAVAWWHAGVHPAGSVGHVAYVERVISPTEIVVSQDSWGGDFSWARITSTSGSWPSGFVHFSPPRLTSQAPPAVTGTPTVGSVLTASPGAWSPAPTSTTYRWSAGGSAVAGATAATFTPTTSQVGTTITVTVTVARSGYPTASATSPATAAVTPAALTSPARPTVTGTPTVGSTLAVSAARFSPAAAGVQYQWTAGTTAIPGATGPTLTVDPPLLGARLSVRVTGTRAGYVPLTVASGRTTPVVPGSITVAAAPALTGTAVPGGLLTVRPGRFDPADATTVVQWSRSGSATPVGTGLSYRPHPADLGHRLVARAHVTRVGYQALDVPVATTAPVRAVPRLVITTRSTGRPHGQVRVTVTVAAVGVSTVPGKVWLSRKGQSLAGLSLRQGTATTTLHGLPLGKRLLRARYTGSLTVASSALLRSYVQVR